MESILTKIEYIQKLSGGNSKSKYIKTLIKNNEFDDELSYVLKFIIDPAITTGISKKKLDKKVMSDVTYDFLEVLKWLETNNTGTDRDIGIVRNFISRNTEHKKILSEIFTKSFKIGLSPKTINKIIPDFIETIEFMKAKNYMDRYEIGKFDFKKEYIISEKLDGIRCAIVKRDKDNIKAYSRQGKEITGLVEIIQAFRSDIFHTGVYDGELLSMGDFPTDELKFQNTCSIVNSKTEEKRNLEFVVFDYINLEDFFKGYSGIPYGERLKTLLEKIDMYIKEELKTKDVYLTNIEKRIFYKKMKVIQDKLFITSTKYKKYFYKGEVTHDHLMDLVNQCDAEGKEGVMINDINAPYKAGRVDAILKLKKNLVADVRIIGFEKGEGKHEGRLGALIVEFDYKGINNVCNIGTGFTDEEREDIWNNQNKYLGKIVEVKYQKITKSKDNKGYSLGFASYNHRIRNDKNETNI